MVTKQLIFVIKHFSGLLKTCVPVVWDYIPFGLPHNENNTASHSQSNLPKGLHAPVHLPAEKAKKASRATKFPSLSKKWPGLNW